MKVCVKSFVKFVYLIKKKISISDILKINYSYAQPLEDLWFQNSYIWVNI